MILKDWLLDLPCVKDRRVIIDVRGPHPTAICGMRAQTIESKEDMINFVASLSLTDSK